MPGLLRTMGRTAVIAGTATTVSNRVSRRQANKWAAQEQQQAPQQQSASPPQEYAQPAPPPAAPEAAEMSMDEKIAQLQKFAELKDQGILTEEEFAAQKAKLLS